LEGSEAVGVGLAAAAEEVEHGGAGVDGEGVEVGLAGEELGEESAVAVAEDEGVVAWRELREEVGAGALEEGAEGEVFSPAVEAGDVVEVRLFHLAKGRRRRGVRRTRSAVARRWMGERRWRRAWRRRSAAELRAQARAGRVVAGVWCVRAAVVAERMRVRVAMGARWAVAQRVVRWAWGVGVGCSHA